jgi:hypothetical protein
VREERVFLEQVADPTLLGRTVDAGGRIEPRVAVDRDRAAVGAEQAGDDAQRRRLARP